MKQHVTHKQLHQLSDKGIKRLREWILSRDYFLGGLKHSEGQWIEVKGRKKGIEEFMWPYPLLSIGQMIEFLNIKLKYINNEQSFAGTGIPQWLVGVELNSSHFKQEREASLCDALWEAVKEVLEK